MSEPMDFADRAFGEARHIAPQWSESATGYGIGASDALLLVQPQFAAPVPGHAAWG